MSSNEACRELRFKSDDIMLDLLLHIAAVLEVMHALRSSSTASVEAVPSARGISRIHGAGWGWLEKILAQGAVNWLVLHVSVTC